MLFPNYFENPEILHVNALEPRSYLIPASSAELAQQSREDSDRFQTLNGEWNFRFEPNVRLLDKPYWLNPDQLEDFDTIPVPSCWQIHGYDYHQYSNRRYPFPYDPPYVPYENPCGIYIREFVYRKKENTRCQLHCEGVDSCYYLWINKQFVGYSQVPHNTTIFDVTDFVCDGANSICFVVLKWCEGSYFEDQDKLRMSGIFRDVYLLTREDNHVEDLCVTTALPTETAPASITLQWKLSRAAAPVSYQLKAPDGSCIAQGTTEDNACTIAVENAQLWTAETPNLYTLLLSCGEEYVAQKIGIREICVSNAVLKINGQPIKFHGVNRHDSDPVTGACISREQMLIDLNLMKAHNINAIRTSHYPPQPVMLELCDEMGFYVIDEADVESHGVVHLYGEEADFGVLADDPTYGKTIMDRIQHMVYRDRNHASVVIWSMGNESGYGRNFVEALAWTKQFDPTRLAHYESARYPARGEVFDLSNVDLHSRMYPPINEVKEYLENYPDKPFIMCEYSHAMGNGPGDLETYHRYMEEYPVFCGGFVWEWCDHSVKRVEEDGSVMYCYGGDFGEVHSDGNFCMDGLVYPDRRVHTGLVEYKQVNRPVRLVQSDPAKGEYVFRNMRYFVYTDHDLHLQWYAEKNGQEVDNGTVSVRVAPQEMGTVHVLPKATWDSLMFRWIDQSGAIVGFDQVLQTEAVTVPAFAAVPGTFDVKEDLETLQIRAGDTDILWSKKTGLPVRIGSFLDKPMEYNIWRAPTDNDRIVKHEWFAAGYDRAITRVKSFTYEVKDGYMEICTKVSLGAVYLSNMMEICAKWQINAEGTLHLDIHAKRNMYQPFLPRFGLRMFVPKSWDKAAYTGYGPQESYADKHQASWYGMFETTPEESCEPYLRPQENGSHWGCTDLKICSADCVASVRAAQPFTFSYLPYSQETLQNTTHVHLLKPDDSNVLCVDFAHSGVGSNSCGPRLDPAYQVNQEEFNYTLQICFQTR